MKREIFFLKNYLFRNYSICEYKQLIKNEGLSPKKLEELNFKKRKEIVTYAYRNSLFYNEFYKKKGFSPIDLICPSDWDKVPVINRKDIIENKEKIIVKGTEKWLIPIATGGSTGTPLKVFHDKRFPSEVLGWRMLRWWNLSPSDDMANVYRSIISSKLGGIIKRVMWFPTKRILLDASSMDEKGIEDFIKKMNKTKPKILEGYIGAIEQLAIYILNNDIIISKPEICQATSSPITKVQRNIIRKAFGCDILDQYGSCEVFWLAQECNYHKGLHVNSDCRHITVLNKDNVSVPDGTLGDFAITDLENKAFPLIKYKNGDRGRFLKERCSCGLPFPLIDNIAGRVTDCIFLPDNSIIGGDYLTTIFDSNPDIVSSFQIHQKKDFSIELSYIPNVGIDDFDIQLSNVKANLELKTKRLVPIYFCPVEQIPHVGGKNRYIISDLLSK